MAIRSKRRKPTGAIDPATGVIRFDESDLVLRPSTTRKELLASPLGQFAETSPDNNHIVHLGLALGRIGGRNFSVTVAFWPSRTIDYVSLSLRDEFPGTTFEQEMTRDASHKRWLRKEFPQITVQTLGEREFPWGTITSRYVYQDEVSRIFITYHPPNDRPQRPARRRAQPKG